MDRQAATLFGVLAVAFLAAILAASMVGDPSTGSDARSSSAPAPEKRLRAKKENVRKNARAITSTRKEETPKPGAAPGGPGNPVKVWGSLSHPKGENAPKNEAERVAGEALAALDPEEGIETIRANLDALEGTEGSSELYAVLGTLYARLDPPDTAAMNEAFEAGLDSAKTEELRADVRFYHARALISIGQHDSALAVLDAGSQAGEAVEVQRFESSVLRGTALEATGDRAGAAAAYSEAMEKAVADGRAPVGEQVNSYRQAGLKLARIYRSQGKNAEADRVAVQLKRWLAP